MSVGYGLIDPKTQKIAIFGFIHKKWAEEQRSIWQAHPKFYRRPGFGKKAIKRLLVVKVYFDD